jgi:hypothetical protein
MNEPDQLIERYLDGDFTPADRKRLSALVVEDATVRERVRAAIELHGTLLVLADKRVACSTETDNLSVFPMKYAPGQPAVAPQPAFPRFAWALAACFVLSFGVFAWQFFAAKPPNAVARLTTDALIDWADAKRPDRNGWLERGVYRLRAGTVRLQTEAGAIVSIAAPAEFELIESDVLRLLNGKLLARMLRDESTLKVMANGLNVVDLGTAFGINTSANGPSLLSVLDGKVELLDSSSNSNAVREIVTAGHSLMFTHDNPPESAVRVTFDGKSFEDLWPLTLGVNAMSNLVRFLAPGPYNNPMVEFKSDNRIYLMPERQGVQLDSPLLFEARRSDREIHMPDYAPASIPAGQRVDSYLLFFNPASSSIEHPISISGRITFNRPILGLIFRQDALFYKSDDQVGVKGLNYRTSTGNRGLEVMPEALPARDIIEVSADGRQLFFNLSVSDLRDQLRVILEADGGDLP